MHAKNANNKSNNKNITIKEWFVRFYICNSFSSISIFVIFNCNCNNSCLYSLIQSESVDYFYLQDPGYEYPPDPEICFSKYKRNGDDDDVENGDDDDDDFDDIKSDNKNSNKINGRTGEKGAKFNMSKGELKKNHFILQ